MRIAELWRYLSRRCGREAAACGRRAAARTTSARRQVRGPEWPARALADRPLLAVRRDVVRVEAVHVVGDVVCSRVLKKEPQGIDKRSRM